MKIILFISILMLSFFSSYAQETIKRVNCSEIGNYLSDCRKMECETTNESGVRVWQKISGLDKKDNCLHEQKIANGKVFKCSYSEDSRKFLAMQIINSKMEPNRAVNKKIREITNNSLSGKNYEPKLVEEIFRHECKIIKGEKNAKK